jgi:hypothetical protein
MDLSRWAFAFVFTQVVEVPIYSHALARSAHQAPLRRICIAFGASTWTHPIVWFLLPQLWALAFTPVVFVRGVTSLDAGFAIRAVAYLSFVEGFAIAGEAAYLKAFGLPSALRWSFLANATSSLIGIASTWLTGWP